MSDADFIIIGTGSAGAALAARLCEAPNTRVLALEYGGSDAGPLIQMPSALSYPMNMARYEWGMRTEPEPYLGGRIMASPRGKVIGGSSSINGMVYVRGHARDFDTWEEMGAKGWGFRHVQPYFQRMESASEGEEGWRGTNGPLHVSRGNRSNPLYRAFIEAGRQAGYPVTPDYNGHQQEGFGFFEMTVKQGQRWSTANAYLRPALKTGALRLEKHALVQRILFEDHRAVGVEYVQNGTVHVARARREIILSASSFNSPKLLMLSGIGDGDHLRAHGIEVRANRPGVGQNLHDHLELLLQMASTQPITLNGQTSLWRKGLIGAQWLLTGKGLGATNHFEACGFIRSRAGIEYPDLQFHFLPAAIRYDGQTAASGHGFQVHVGPNRSASRGSVTLRSARPEDPPRILFNYMSKLEDWQDFRTAIRLTREIIGQEAFAPFRGGEISPGASVLSDEAIDAHVREHVESAYHPCGTSRMGAVDDPLAVVDPECRVIGVEGLRVVDSSIIPAITNGNLNGPSIMIGEKASDLILGRAPLAASNLEPWIHPDWRTRQR